MENDELYEIRIQMEVLKAENRRLSNINGSTSSNNTKTLNSNRVDDDDENISSSQDAQHIEGNPSSSDDDLQDQRIGHEQPSKTLDDLLVEEIVEYVEHYKAALASDNKKLNFSILAEKAEFERDLARAESSSQSVGVKLRMTEERIHTQAELFKIALSEKYLNTTSMGQCWAARETSLRDLGSRKKEIPGNLKRQRCHVRDHATGEALWATFEIRWVAGKRTHSNSLDTSSAPQYRNITDPFNFRWSRNGTQVSKRKRDSVLATHGLVVGGVIVSGVIFASQTAGLTNCSAEFGSDTAAQTSLIVAFDRGGREAIGWTLHRSRRQGNAEELFIE